MLLVRGAQANSLVVHVMIALAQEDGLLQKYTGVTGVMAVEKCLEKTVSIAILQVSQYKVQKWHSLVLSKYMTRRLFIFRKN